MFQLASQPIHSPDSIDFFTGARTDEFNNCVRKWLARVASKRAKILAEFGERSQHFDLSIVFVDLYE